MEELILFYDTETTGMPDWKSPSGGENQPHLVQIAACLADPDSRKVIQSIDLIIQPDGWEISAECTEVHGITTEYALQHGVPEKAALEAFLALWGGRTRVAHGRTFDQRIIRIATKRYCSEDVIDRWADKEGHDCTMFMAKPVMKMPPKNRYGYKSPKLREAYEYFTGKNLEDAHTASADMNACMEIYWALQDLESEAA